ncbi:MAG TPA: glycosyltransferase family 4 protein [Solirubrobacteraceae bacterium]
MPGHRLRIAYLGPDPGGYSGVRAVAAELIGGLARRGHEVDCFLLAPEGQPEAGIAGDETIAFGEGNLAFGENVTLIWGTNGWRWDRWYSRNKFTAFASGLVARAFASLRMRRTVKQHHRRRPYDLIYQFSAIETFGVPRRLRPQAPLVIHPETHLAGELRWLIAERRLALRCHSRSNYAAVFAIALLRTLVQRRAIRRASLLVCISEVFRDHIVRDYRFPLRRTTVAPNPIRTERFALGERPVGDPATVLVLGRISARKGVETVIDAARLALARDMGVRFRVVGGPSLWSDYTCLLEDLPRENAEYAGSASAAEVVEHLRECDVLLQASRYEPFGLTVAEALAAGVPVVATTEVGAIENVNRSVVREVAPGDAEAVADAIGSLLDQLKAAPAETRTLAHAEARRLFEPDVVCGQISAALEELAFGSGPSASASAAAPEHGRRGALLDA